MRKLTIFVFISLVCVDSFCSEFTQDVISVTFRNKKFLINNYEYYINEESKFNEYASHSLLNATLLIDAVGVEEPRRPLYVDELCYFFRKNTEIISRVDRVLGGGTMGIPNLKKENALITSVVGEDLIKDCAGAVVDNDVRSRLKRLRE